MINKRSVVIIDGSNLYFKLKSLGLEKGIKFNYKGWIKKLTEETTLVAVYYCVGKIRAKQKDIKAQPSYALLKTCKRSILIDKNDIKEFKSD